VEKQPRISQNITMRLAGKNMAVRVQLESIEEEIKILKDSKVDEPSTNGFVDNEEVDIEGGIQ
jgi:hypothetical protein